MHSDTEADFGAIRPASVRDGTRRGAGKPWRAWLVGLMLACTGAIAPTLAEARLLIKNINQTEGTRANVGEFSGDEFRQAQEFTTGDATFGYVLDSIGVVVSNQDSDDIVKMELYDADSGGDIQNKLFTLTAPSSFPDTQTHKFDAPSNRILQPNTKYFVRLENSATGERVQVRTTANDSEDGGAASGWSIANNRLEREDSGSWRTHTSSIKIQVDGSIVNRDATGKPTIVGLIQPGQTLRVDTSAIQDPNGLDDVSYTFSWWVIGEEEARSNGSTFVPQADDFGKEIQVVARFKDDDGNSERLASVEYGPVTFPPLRAPTCRANDIWCATVQAHEIRSGDSVEGHGYRTTGDYGELSDTEFTYSSTDYTVEEVSESTGGILTLVLLPRGNSVFDTDQYKLWVGTQEFLFNEATHPNGFFAWSGAGLDWDLGDQATVRIAKNRPPSGAVAITGTARHGQTLTAGTDTIADGNGLISSRFDYQWVRVDGANQEDIAGAESSTYTVAYEDVGTKLKVRVKYTDDDGFQETIRSGETATVSHIPLATPACEADDLWCATMRAGEVESAGKTWHGYWRSVSEGILSNGEFRYRSGTSENQRYVVARVVEESGNVTLTLNPSGETVFNDDQAKLAIGLPRTAANELEFSFADISSRSSDGFTWSNTGINFSPGEQANVRLIVNHAPTGAPTITGILRDGQTLTASVAQLGDRNGVTESNASYQWIEVDGENETEISGATSKTYVLSHDDVGKKFKVDVEYVDDDGFDERETSSATATVQHRLFATPTCGGNDLLCATMRVDEVASIIGFTNDTDPVTGDISTRTFGSYAVEELFHGIVSPRSVGLVLSPDGVTELGTSDYQLRLDDHVFVLEDGADLSGVFRWPAPSGLAWEPGEQVNVRLVENAAPTGVPVITGTAAELTASIDGISDANGFTRSRVAYEWLRVDGATETEIPGATSRTYRPGADDVGKQLKVGVRYIDHDGFEEGRIDSAPWPQDATIAGNTPATGEVTLSGIARVGKTLAASATITDANGYDAADLRYAWVRVDGGDETVIRFQTGSTYLLAASDEGKQVKVRVSFNDADGYLEEVESEAYPADGTVVAQNVTTVPVTCNGEREVWSATMTVGTSPDGAANGLGYVNFTGTMFGSISDDEFKEGGRDYEIKSLVHTGSRKLGVRINPTSHAEETFNDNYTLCVGSTVWNFGDAAFQSNEFLWDNIPFNWSNGDQVGVKIIYGDDGPPTLTTATVDEDGEGISLVFNEDLDLASAQTLPTRVANAFSVSAGNENVPIANITWDGASKDRLAINFDTGEQILEDETVTLSYDRTNASTDSLKDGLGNELLSFTNLAVTNDSVVRPETSGASAIVELSVAPATVVEGKPGDAGDRTVTWTLTATTDEDEAPEAGLDVTMRVLTRSRTASAPGDYIAVDETVRFQGSDTWVRESLGTSHAYVATKTGTITIKDDRFVESDETFVVAVERTANSGNFALGTDVSATVTIADEDGLSMPVSVPSNALVSNVGQNANNDVYAIGHEEFEAQGFRTGANALGYWLTRAYLYVGGIGTDATASQVRVTLRAKAAGGSYPGTKLATFTNPSTGTLRTAGLKVFHLPSPYALEKETTYYIAVQGLASGVDFAWGYTESSAEDAGAEEGFSLGNVSVYEDFLSWSPNTYAYRVALAGRARDENSVATGSPTVTGTPTVRETLTAGVGTITDVNGLPTWPEDYRFQWMRLDAGTATDIAGATEQSYTLSQSDRGKKIQVAVSFTDNEGYAETRTSALFPKKGVISADSVGPKPVSAKVPASGMQVEVVFDEVLDAEADAIAPAAAFTVEVGDEDTAAVSGITVASDSKTATLTLDRTVYRGETVLVSYTDPTSEDDAAALQDADGYDVVSFVDLEAENESTVIAPADPPSGLTAIATGETRIDVSWVAPLKTGGRPILGYRIELYDEDNERWTTLVASQEAVSYADKGLSPGTARHYRVRTITATGTSDPSTSASATTPLHPHCGAGDVWCAVLTVQEFASGDYGCIQEGDGKTCAGALTDDDFSYNGFGHAVRYLEVDSASIYFGLADDLPSDANRWTLHIGSDTFDFSDGENETSKSAAWENDEGLSWSAGDQVLLRLRASETSPAAGMPTISGRTEVGETLMAERGSLVDADGMPAVFPDDFDLQWVRVDGTDETDIADATEGTYTLVAGDAGKRIKLRVSFTDGAGESESRTSDASAIVAPMPPTPAHCQAGDRWCATLTVGTITDNTGSDFAPGFNASKNEGALSHQRFRFNGKTFEVARIYDDGHGAFAFQLEPHGRETFEGNKAMLHIGTTDLTFSDGAFLADDMGRDRFFGWTGTGLSWSVGDTVNLRLLGADNSAPTGRPTIQGTAKVVATLTAGTDALGDANGTDNADFTYQWVRVDGNDEADISEATDRTYLPGPADEGKNLRVKVAYTDDDGYENEATSNVFPAIGTIGEADIVAATCRGEEIWSANLEVGERPNGELGYGDHSGTSNDHGSLSPADMLLTYESGGATTTERFTVEVLALGTQANPTLSLRFDKSANDAINDSDILCLGEESLRFADADHSGTTFSWSNAGLKWDDGARTEVKILDDNNGPVPVSAKVEKGQDIDVIITFDEDITELPDQTPLTVFSIKIEGETNSVRSVTKEGKRNLRLTIGEFGVSEGTRGFSKGERGTFSYDPEINSENAIIKDTGGNAAPAVKDFPVENNSEQTRPPKSPVKLRVASVESQRIEITWNPPRIKGGLTISGYKIEGSQDENVWTTLADNHNSTNYFHTGVETNTTYYYRVSAINSRGPSDPSNITSANINRPGTPPTGLTATQGQANIVLEWSPPAVASDVTGYWIEFSSDSGTTWETLVESHDSTSVTYSHSGLATDVEHHYRVSAIRTSSTSSASNVVVGKTTVTRPNRLLAGRAEGAIILQWSGPPNATDVTGYLVEVSGDGGSSWTILVENHSGTSYSHTGLPPNSTRHYRVSSIRESGTSPPSNIANATTAGSTDGPRFVEAEISASGRTLAVLFHENIQGSNLPATSQWTVTANGGDVFIASLSRDDSNSKVLNIALSQPILHEQTVRVGYEDPSSGNDANAIQDSSGNDAPSFTDQPVRNRSDLNQSDPSFVRAEVDASGTTVAVTFSEKMAEEDFPSNDKWTVKADGTRISVTVQARNGDNNRVIDLTLASTVGKGQTVTISYEDPTAGNDENAVQDFTDNDVASFTDKPVSNNSTQKADPAPVLQSANVASTGLAIALKFDEPLRQGTGKAKDLLRVESNGTEIGISNSITSGDEVGIALTTAICPDDTVTVSYADPTTGDDDNAIQDEDGNDVASFTTGQDGVPAVTNNSTADCVAPTLSDEEFGGVKTGVGIGGDLIDLVFNESMDLPTTEFLSESVRKAFIVTADDNEVGINNITRKDALNKRILVLRRNENVRIYEGQTVKLSYDREAAGDDALKDEAGNELESFTDLDIPNNSTADNTPPTLESAEVQASGDRIRMMFSEHLDGTTDFLPAAVKMAFTVKVNGFARTFGAIARVTDNDREYELRIQNLIPVIYPGQTVTLGYDADAAGDEALTDDSDNKLASFSDFAVENSSTAASPSDATLTSLAVRNGAIALAFDHPVFTSMEADYYLSVPNNLRSLTVLATTNGANATIAFLDGSDATLTDQSAVDGLQTKLSVGANVIKVKVTSADETATKTYTIHVGRASGAPSGTCSVTWCANLTLGTDSSDNGEYGYSSTGVNGIKGALAPATFSIDNVAYPVEQLWYEAAGNRVKVRFGADLPAGHYTLTLGVFEGDFESDGTEREWDVNLRTSSLPRVFGSIVEVGLRPIVGGTLDILVSPETASEGDTITWTVRATTDQDAAPESTLDFRKGVSTVSGTASSLAVDGIGDYALVQTRVRFQGTDTWTRTEVETGIFRYIAEKTGTTTIHDDLRVEADEEFKFRLDVQPGVLPPFSIDGNEATVTIEDEDTYGIRATVSPNVLPIGATTDVTVTHEILDSDGSPQGSRDCLIERDAGVADVGTTVGGNATSSDLAYTVSSGSLTDVDFDRCEGTQETVLEITVEDDATPARTITFSPTVTDDTVDTSMLERATARIESGGTVELLVSPATPSEGDTVTWTVRAVTDTDEEPEDTLNVSLGIQSDGMSAMSPDDYAVVAETRRLQGSETWTRTEVETGVYRYVREETGTVDIADDLLVEPVERFSLTIQHQPGGVPFALTTPKKEITIEDDDTFGLRATVSPDAIAVGETTTVTVTLDILDGDGTEQGARDCIVDLAQGAANASVTLGGTAGTTDFSYTVSSGSLTDNDFAKCEGSKEIVLAVTVPESARSGRTITFTPAITHDQLGATLVEAATVKLQGTGTIALEVDSDTVSEGDTVRWTVRAATDADEAPESGLDMRVKVATSADTANGDAVDGSADYTSVDQELRFRSTDTWTRTEVETGVYRYVTTRTGTLTVSNDDRVEADEVFDIVLSPVGGPPIYGIEDAASDGSAKTSVTIEDEDKFGIKATVSPNFARVGETTNVTITLDILDGSGTAQGARDCIVDHGNEAASVSVTLGGTAGNTDYSYTVSSGSLTDTDFAGCEGSKEIVLAIVVPDSATSGSTITFTPAITHDGLDATLIEAATVRLQGSGTIALEVDSDTVDEGDTLTWTVRAMTDADEAPESGLDMRVRVMTSGDTANGDAVDGTADYTSLDQELRFRTSDTWTRKEVETGVYRYVNERTGTLSVNHDDRVEDDEIFYIELRPVDGPLVYGIQDITIENLAYSEITIEDDDSFGLKATVSPTIVRLGTTTTVTVTVDILDGNGTAQRSRECIVDLDDGAKDASLGVTRTATADDLTYTIESGSLTDIDFGECEGAKETVLEVTVPATAVKGRTVTFTPAITHDDIDTSLIEGATLIIEGAVPEQVTGVEVDPGNTRIAVSWTAVPDSTGYAVEWKSGSENYASSRRKSVSGGTSTSTTVTGLGNDTKYTVRVLAVNAEGDGSPSDEVTATPNDGTRLSALTISTGALSPAFEPSVTNYTAEVAVANLTILATPVDEDSGVRLGTGFSDSDSSTEGFQIALAMGENVVRVVVDSEHSGVANRRYTLAITRVPAPTISIEPSHPMVALAHTNPEGKLDFTLTRNGDKTIPLDVTLKLEQKEAWLTTGQLSHDVTFSAGSATAKVSLTRSWFWANSTTLGSGDLTATLADVAGYDVTNAEATVYVHGRSAVTGKARLTEDSYRFDEETQEHTITAEMRLEPKVRPETLGSLRLALTTKQDSATGGDDYTSLSGEPFAAMEAADFALDNGRWVATQDLVFEIKDDDLFEGDERIEFELGIGAPEYPHATFPLCRDNDCNTNGDPVAYPVVIKDSDELTGANAELGRRYILETDDTNTTDDERSTTMTVSFEGRVAPSEDGTLTLRLSGSATRGTDYTISPVDADGNANGHQVTWTAEEGSAEVTFTARSDSTANESERIQIAASLAAHGETFDFPARTLNIFEDADNVTFRGPVSEGYPPVPDYLFLWASLPNVIRLEFPVITGHGVTGYWIEGSDDAGATWFDVESNIAPGDLEQKVLSPGQTDNIYYDKPVATGTTRHYRVSALNARGASHPSSVQHITAEGPYDPAEDCEREGAIWCSDVTFRVRDDVSTYASADQGHKGYMQRPIFVIGDSNYRVKKIVIPHGEEGTVTVMVRPVWKGLLNGHSIWIDDEELVFDRADYNKGLGVYTWGHRGFDAGNKALVTIGQSGPDEIRPRVLQAYTLADGAEVIVELSEAVASEERALTEEEVESFSLYDVDAETTTSFASGAIANAQTVEDDTGNENLLGGHNREAVRVLRLVLPEGAPIVVDEFVQVRYDGEAGLADLAENELEAFEGADGFPVSNHSEQGASSTQTGAPSIIEIDTDLPEDGSWDARDWVTVTVQFSRAVEVETRNGTPRIAVGVGPITVTMPYVSGSMSDTLTFRYRLANGFPSSDTLTVEANAFMLNGAEIRSAQGHEVTLSHIGFAFDASGGEPDAPELTVALQNAPTTHDGQSAFNIRLLFSDNITVSAGNFPQAFDVTNGSVESASRVSGRRDRWDVTVTPSGDDDVTVVLRGGRVCGSGGIPCMRDPNDSDARITLTGDLTVTVEGPEVEDPLPVPLTAEFQEVPTEHDGASQFEIRVAFSEAITNSYRHVHTAATVTGGTASSAKRIDGRHDLWWLRIVPSGNGPVTVTLQSGGTCGTGDTSVLCTEDGRALSNSPSAEVLGPAAISIADARAEEGVDATIDFTVSLDRDATKQATVDYATQDGTATAGADYTATSGTLTFEIGDREKTISVTLLDDAVDEGEETFTVTLSNATGARIEDATATGTIENSDPLQKAWISRFGRTVASQVVEAISNRVSREQSKETQLTFAGFTVDANGELPDENELLRDKLAGQETFEERFDRVQKLRNETETGTMTTEEILLGSAFQIAGGSEDGTASWGAWGSIAKGGFEADVEDVTLSGEVTTGIFGADFSRGRWIAGLAISSSRGDGEFSLTTDAASTRSSGEIESTLTAVYPYAKRQFSDRLDAWVLGGIGTGDLTIKQDGDEPMKTDLGMRMGAIGARGQMLEAPPKGGMNLALKSDAMWVGMKSDALDTEDGRLAGAEADVTRLRLIMEASRPIVMDGERTLTPSVEIGVRHDGGDAETGAGLEAGGRIEYTAPGFSIAGAVRGLVAHEDSGYEEWGASGAVRIDPGTSGRGLSFSVTPTWGVPGSGVEQLYGMEHTRGLANDREFDAQSRVDAEIGYGIGLQRAPGVVTPYTGISLSQGGVRTLRIGSRWQITPEATMGIEATRQETGNEGAATSEIMLRSEIRW